MGRLTSRRPARGAKAAGRPSQPSPSLAAPSPSAQHSATAATSTTIPSYSPEARTGAGQCSCDDLPAALHEDFNAYTATLDLEARTLLMDAMNLLEDDSDSKAVVIALLCERKEQGHARSSATSIPELQAQVTAHTAQGQLHAAFSVQCEQAYLALMSLGPHHPSTLQYVHDVAQGCFVRGWAMRLSYYYVWLLPRAEARWGLHSAGTLQLLQRASIFLAYARNPEQHSSLSRTVTALAQQLPHGLGWGSTVVAPVPDEDTFNRHAVLQRKGIEALQQGHYKLAFDMLTRCVAYFDTLGPHWLATVRKFEAARNLAACMQHTDSKQAALSYILSAKRHCRRELGPTHEVTATNLWKCAVLLCACGRHEAGVSTLQKVVNIYKDTQGLHSCKELCGQVGTWAPSVGTRAHVCTLMSSTNKRTTAYFARLPALLCTHHMGDMCVCVAMHASA